MAVEKVTMVLQVDVQCPRSREKIGKTLCKFPQIMKQVYYEEANRVAITVASRSPKKIRDGLLDEGGKVIKSIEIKENKLGKPQEQLREAEKHWAKLREAEKHKAKLREAEKHRAQLREAEKHRAQLREAEKHKAMLREAEKHKDKPREQRAERPRASGKGDKPKEMGIRLVVNVGAVKY